MAGTDNSLVQIVNCPNSGKSKCAINAIIKVVYNIMKVSNYAEIAILMG